MFNKLREYMTRATDQRRVVLEVSGRQVHQLYMNNIRQTSSVISCYHPRQNISSLMWGCEYSCAVAEMNLYVTAVTVEHTSSLM